jgi:regulator of replication initiation timing
MSGKVTQKGVEQAVLDLANYERQVVATMESIEKLKHKIHQYFDENDKTQITVIVDDVNTQRTVTAKKQEKVYIKYDVEKLKDTLDPEMFTEVTKKAYTINNMEKLVGLCKQAGIKPKEFKKLVDVRIDIDGPAIKRLYDAKELTLKDIKGCYEAKISKSIKIIEGGKN